MIGKQIRVFFRELLGSRVVETLNAQAEIIANMHAMQLAEKELLAARLEEDLLRLRSDYDNRLQDKDRIIEDLRAEKATLTGKVFLYETTLLPLASRAGAAVVAAGKPKQPSFAMDFNAPPVKSRWQVIQDQHDASMKTEREEEARAARDQVKQAAVLSAAGGNENGGQKQTSN